MKITNLIFGIVLASLVMTSFGLMMADLNTNYSTDAWNNETALFDKLEEQEDMADLLEENLEEPGQDSGIFDILGNIVTKAVQSLKLTYASLDSAISMTSETTKTLGLPSIFYTAGLIMLMVFVFIGVIISAMVKKDL